MPKYLLRRIVWEEVDLEDDQVMTLADAARELGKSLNTVIGNAEAGRLTMVVKEEEGKPWAPKRMVLKDEIEDWKEREAG